ncbi:receptor-like protein EIX2 isoform X2 [Diospyros lotus]|uniref:receptor-like protein EIX2 isoform X2 n=1 Tax=Diospyros lotus TaxID=55363 RepID=UPI002250C3A8|nr:receptor-like protein EIX2 isoform X2 [Diospyros lotus]XP_052186005.1 receptor-like protein EIX2 isoform X2 [Diospyros lotus]
MRTVAVFVLVWSLCATASSGGVSCNEKEKQALLVFKQALSSDPLGALSSWSHDVRDTDCCNWTGVRCNNMTGRVVELDLSNLHLMGNLTPSLLDLKFLSYLDLTLNYFGGSSIPSFLGSMTSLVHLNLEDNDFEGLIPHQLQNLSNIRYLNLGFNYGLYVDNLNWIAHLRALEFLDMSGLDLNKEVDWLREVSSLPSLSELYLDDCQLENMTPSLEHVNFTSLTSLVLSGNNFNCEIPKWLFNLNSSLRSLDLSGNFLHGFIPYEVGQLKHLERLDLGMNKLNGTLPKSIWVLSNLVTLDIGNNLLEGIVTEANLSKLSKLRIIYLSGNSFSCNISSTWVPPLQLKIISVGSCKMGPNFPSWLKTQISLSILDISKTGISDTIPHWFWDLALHVKYIDLSQNQIDGDLSSVMLNSTIVDISSNRFRGKVPHLSSNVKVFNVANNNFSGPISTFLCQKENKQNTLEVLDASYNFLSGNLSHCWMNWKSLIHVNLGNNNLSGEIPIPMGSLSKLQSLQLHNNKLFGYIPSSLKNCQFLGIMNLGGNELTGTVPSWLGHITNLSILSLCSNKFTGSISPDICHLSSLIVLDLSNNILVGSIPKCLTNITEMVDTDGSYQNTFIYDTVIYDTIIYDNFTSYEERLSLVTKGRETEYKEILPLVRSIDLSSNGNSGVGPDTSCAASLFVKFANNGHPTLVVSTDPAHSLSDSFAQDLTGRMLVPVEGPDYPLFALERKPKKMVGVESKISWMAWALGCLLNSWESCWTHLLLVWMKQLPFPRLCNSLNQRSIICLRE